ncbi:hypothetical protein Tco_1466201 [Tanacetum coccineum]
MPLSNSLRRVARTFAFTFHPYTRLGQVGDRVPLTASCQMRNLREFTSDYLIPIRIAPVVPVHDRRTMELVLEQPEVESTDVLAPTPLRSVPGATVEPPRLDATSVGFSEDADVAGAESEAGEVDSGLKRKRATVVECMRASQRRPCSPTPDWSQRRSFEGLAVDQLMEICYDMSVQKDEEIMCWKGHVGKMSRLRLEVLARSYAQKLAEDKYCTACRREWRSCGRAGGEVTQTPLLSFDEDDLTSHCWPLLLSAGGSAVEELHEKKFAEVPAAQGPAVLSQARTWRNAGSYLCLTGDIIKSVYMKEGDFVEGSSLEAHAIRLAKKKEGAWEAGDAALPRWQFKSKSLSRKGPAMCSTPLVDMAMERCMGVSSVVADLRRFVVDEWDNSRGRNIAGNFSILWDVDGDPARCLLTLVFAALSAQYRWCQIVSRCVFLDLRSFVYLSLPGCYSPGMRPFHFPRGNAKRACPVSASSLSEESSEDELTLLRRLRRLSSVLTVELGGL